MFARTILALYLISLTPTSISAQAALPTDTYSYVDFDTSMGLGSTEYEKKFMISDDHKRGLSFCRFLYRKNNPVKVEISPTSKIPKIIHQIWVGKKPLPKSYEKLKETWIKHHPDWEYRLWTEKEIAQHLKMHNMRYYYMTKDPIEKANLVRYEVLYNYGGIYVDIDFMCLKSFDSLHHRYDFYTGIQPPDTKNLLNNALIACGPGHPILKHCIETVKDDWHLKDRFKRDGVTHFSKSFTQMALKAPGITIALPASYFYPLQIGFKADAVPALEDIVKPESYAVHYWAANHGDPTYHVSDDNQTVDNRTVNSKSTNDIVQEEHAGNDTSSENSGEFSQKTPY